MVTGFIHRFDLVIILCIIVARSHLERFIDLLSFREEVIVFVHNSFASLIESLVADVLFGAFELMADYVKGRHNSLVVVLGQILGIESVLLVPACLGHNSHHFIFKVGLKHLQALASLKC